MRLIPFIVTELLINVEHNRPKRFFFSLYEKNIILTVKIGLHSERHVLDRAPKKNNH